MAGDDARWPRLRARRGYVGARIAADGRVEPVGGDDATTRGGPDPPDASDAGDPVLVASIREEIERGGGRITFARFMERALYDSRRGYYATSAERPTRSGDFLTAPEVHPAFGRLIARQLTEMWERLDRPQDFVLAEHGAGRGALGEAIVRGLERDGSELFGAIRYRPGDAVPGRDEAARERIQRAGFDNALEAQTATSFTGCILANELLDAFPVHRVGRLDGELVEWYVRWVDGAFGEEPGEPSDPAIAAQLAREDVALRDGQRAEVSLMVAPWLTDAVAGLKRGYVLVIDYGYPASELYGPRRSGGTLRVFRGHHVSADPFRAVGRQDLTAHVDLTALEHAAASAGLALLGRTTQSELLIGLGLGALLQEAQADPRSTWSELLAVRAAAVRFIDPGALGGFAVMIFGRGVPDGPPLRGLDFRVPRYR